MSTVDDRLRKAMRECHADGDKLAVLVIDEQSGQEPGIIANAQEVSFQGNRSFAVAVMALSKEHEAATAFIKFVTSPDAGALLQKGMMEPAR